MGCYHPIESLLVLLTILIISVREFIHLYPPFYVKDWGVILRPRVYMFDLYDTFSSLYNQAPNRVMIGYFSKQALVENWLE